jgi:protein-tyrosine phosphatase
LIRVLFVCLGNICRSPMAEAVFTHKVRKAGLEKHFQIDSAGTGGWYVGSPAHYGTRKLLSEKNIPYDGRARQICSRDLMEFDYIVTMDNMNLEDVQRMGPTTAKIANLLSYSPQSGVTEVPDPYYTGQFELAYELIDEGTDGLLRAIRREHNL